MKTQAFYPGDAIGRSLIMATHAGVLAGSLSDFIGRIAAARRARAERRARIRERVRTARIMAELPYDIRADVGWPARYEEQSEA